MSGTDAGYAAPAAYDARAALMGLLLGVSLIFVVTGFPPFWTRDVFHFLSHQILGGATVALVALSSASTPATSTLRPHLYGLAAVGLVMIVSPFLSQVIPRDLLHYPVHFGGGGLGIALSALAFRRYKRGA